MMWKVEKFGGFGFQMVNLVGFENKPAEWWKKPV